MRPLIPARRRAVLTLPRTMLKSPARHRQQNSAAPQSMIVTMSFVAAAAIGHVTPATLAVAGLILKEPVACRALAELRNRSGQALAKNPSTLCAIQHPVELPADRALRKLRIGY
jgi:hypothetical protein